MVLTCGDREWPSQIMRLIAVACNCVLLSAVVTGGLPQLCPNEISENCAARMPNIWRIQEETWDWMQPIRTSPDRVVRPDQRHEQPWLTSPPQVEVAAAEGSSPGRMLCGMTGMLAHVPRLGDRCGAIRCMP